MKSPKSPCQVSTSTEDVGRLPVGTLDDAFASWSIRYLRRQWEDKGMPPSVWQKFNAYAKLCGSLIERKMLAGLMFCPFGFYDEMNQLMSWSEVVAGAEAESGRAVIIPQANIRKLDWRVDFFISLDPMAPGAKRPEFVIECDGHDFHERTKEQAAKDRKRDRDLQAMSIPILRFTGSEIVRDLDHCVSQIDCFGSDLIEKAFTPHMNRGA